VTVTAVFCGALCRQEWIVSEVSRRIKVVCSIHVKMLTFRILLWQLWVYTQKLPQTTSTLLKFHFFRFNIWISFQFRRTFLGFYT
jgi:hypothetical protein